MRTLKQYPKISSEYLIQLHIKEEQKYQLPMVHTNIRLQI